jgi:hypothetical protein
MSLIRCGGEKYPINITVSYTGTPGLKFIGVYGSALSGTTSIPEGTVPFTCTTQCKSKTDVVSAVGQMYPGTASGTLTLKLLKDNKVLDEKTTTDPNEQIQVIWSPSAK